MTDEVRKFRTTRGGVSVDLLIGDRPDPANPGRRTPISRSEIAPAGKVYDNLAPHLVDKYDNNDEHVRSLLEEVDDDGGAVGAPTVEGYEGLQSDLGDASTRIQELEAENEGLRDELQKAADELTQASADLNAAQGGQAEQVTELQARVAELEQQLEEATAPAGEGGAAPPVDEFAALDDDGLKAAGREAGYPKLGDTNWSELDDDQKREALRQHAAAAPAEGGDQG